MEKTRKTRRPGKTRKSCRHLERDDEERAKGGNVVEGRGGRVRRWGGIRNVCGEKFEREKF